MRLNQYGFKLISWSNRTHHGTTVHFSTPISAASLYIHDGDNRFDVYKHGKFQSSFSLKTPDLKYITYNFYVLSVADDIREEIKVLSARSSGMTIIEFKP